jgi:hypothetical protein
MPKTKDEKQKVVITIDLDPEVIAYHETFGDLRDNEMNKVLRREVRRASRA